MKRVDWKIPSSFRTICIPSSWRLSWLLLGAMSPSSKLLPNLPNELIIPFLLQRSHFMLFYHFCMLVSFLSSFSRSLLNTYHVSGTVLPNWNIICLEASYIAQLVVKWKQCLRCWCPRLEFYNFTYQKPKLITPFLHLKGIFASHNYMERPVVTFSKQHC